MARLYERNSEVGKTSEFLRYIYFPFAYQIEPGPA